MEITLSRIVSELQRQKKMQYELTDYLGINYSSFAAWKAGRNKSYQKYLHAIADFLDVSVEYLKGETDQKRKNLVNGDEELTELLEELKNRDEMRALFKLSSKASKEDVEQTIRILKAIKGDNNGTD